CQYLEQQKIITGHKVATGAENILSLMQGGGLIVGQPFFCSWEDPAANGFIDGNGTVADLEAAIRSGVAGGHETYWAAIEQIGWRVTGDIDRARPIIRFRNSWGLSWADRGEALAHLSTFVWLAAHCDFRQFTTS